MCGDFFWGEFFFGGGNFCLGGGGEVLGIWGKNGVVGKMWIKKGGKVWCWGKVGSSFVLCLDGIDKAKHSNP